MDRPIRHIIKDGKSDTASHEQKQEFLSLFHQLDVEHALKNQMIDDLNETEPTSKEKLFFHELFEKFWRNRKVDWIAQPQKNRFVIRFAQWAAILAVGLFLGYYIHSINKFDPPVYFTSISPKGSVSEMFLPDGTQIYLNSGSQIKYLLNGGDDSREVYLSGEAFFQVAKLNGKPFMVHTSAYNVKVTGTKFNVKAYPDEKEVATTLEEGCVQIESSANLKLTNEAILKPGEQLVYSKESRNIHIAEVNTKWFTSWTENKLVFVNMSLKDLKTLLERKYGVDIEFSDQSILNYHYDGTLKNETILEVLEILENTLPIHYEIVGQKIVIQKK